jgi:hypothetical protein
VPGHGRADGRAAKMILNDCVLGEPLCNIIPKHPCGALGEPM